MGARGYDHGLSLINIALCVRKPFHRAFQLHLFNGGTYPVYPELIHLLCHASNEGGAGFLRLHHLARIILNIRGDGDLPSILSSLDQKGV